MGATFVRIPVKASDFTQPAGNTTIGFEILDNVVEWANANSIYVIISLAIASRCQNAEPYCSSSGNADLWMDSQAQLDTVQCWRGIAERYSQEEMILGYDLLERPLAPTDTHLQSMYERIIAAIRIGDPNHIIFLQGNNLGKDFAIFQSRWVLQVDNNTAYSLQIDTDSDCPSLVDYSTSVDDAVKPVELVRDDNLPVLTLYKGQCQDYLEALYEKFQGDSIFQPTGYWTYKTISYSTKPMAIFNMKDKSSWEDVRSRLDNSQFITTSEWQNFRTALRQDNFESGDVGSVIQDYFGGKSITYTWGYWWLIGLVIGLGLLLMVGVIVAGVLYYRKKKKYNYWS
eukprot:TRINITY_DN3631_c0_g1_i3.p1 TRINITY_DN3631_c0_g1~~TRINITY_DN3631_c0_g1_i3.p1  ORF type:complete len:342 (+),score=81.30 TRINITY_DN3631_c0_g1_i3:362-1387(+)